MNFPLKFPLMIVCKVGASSVCKSSKYKKYCLQRPSCNFKCVSHKCWDICTCNHIFREVLHGWMFVPNNEKPSEDTRSIPIAVLPVAQTNLCLRTMSNICIDLWPWYVYNCNVLWTKVRNAMSVLANFPTGWSDSRYDRIYSCASESKCAHCAFMLCKCILSLSLLSDAYLSHKDINSAEDGE